MTLLQMKVADIGISVDTAVDIAKESADVILLEKKRFDDFEKRPSFWTRNFWEYHIEIYQGYSKF